MIFLVGLFQGTIDSLFCFHSIVFSGFVLQSPDYTSLLRKASENALYLQCEL